MADLTDSFYTDITLLAVKCGEKTTNQHINKQSEIGPNAVYMTQRHILSSGHPQSINSAAIQIAKCYLR